MLPMKNSSEAEHPVAALDEHHRRAPTTTPIIMKMASSFFLMPVKSAIAPRIGRHDRDDRDRDRGDGAEARRRLRRLEPGRRVGGVERREDGGDDGGEVGGVGPVVPRPRPLLGRDEADTGERARDHARQNTSRGRPEPQRRAEDARRQSTVESKDSEPRTSCEASLSFASREAVSCSLANAHVAAEGLQPEVGAAAAVERRRGSCACCSTTASPAGRC